MSTQDNETVLRLLTLAAQLNEVAFYRVRVGEPLCKEERSAITRLARRLDVLSGLLALPMAKKAKPAAARQRRLRVGSKVGIGSGRCVTAVGRVEAIE